MGIINETHFSLQFTPSLIHASHAPKTSRPARSDQIERACLSTKPTTVSRSYNTVKSTSPNPTLFLIIPHLFAVHTPTSLDNHSLPLATTQPTPPAKLPSLGLNKFLCLPCMHPAQKRPSLATSASALGSLTQLQPHSHPTQIMLAVLLLTCMDWMNKLRPTTDLD